MTVSTWRCIVSWSSLSAVYRVPVPGSSRNFLRLKGSVLLRSVKVSLFFSSLSTALICTTSVPGGLSSETFTSYHFWENCGRWLLVSMTRISTYNEKIHYIHKVILVIVFGGVFFGLFFTADFSHLPNKKNRGTRSTRTCLNWLKRLVLKQWSTKLQVQTQFAHSPKIQ